MNDLARPEWRIPVIYAVVGSLTVTLIELLWGHLGRDGSLVHLGNALSIIAVSAIVAHILLRIHERRSRALRSGLQLAALEAKNQATLASTIQAAIPSGIIVVDADARVQSWSASAQALLGWTEAEIIGMEVPSSDPVRAAQYRERLASISATGIKQRATMRRHRRDGTLVDLVVDVAPLPSRRDAQGRPLLVLSVTDITEVETLRRDLASAAERWRLGVEAVREGILDWDLTTDRMTRSPLLLELIGTPDGPAEVHGDEMWKLVWPTDLALLRAAGQRLRDGVLPRPIKVRLGTLGGAFRWVRLTGVCGALKDGVPERAVMAVREVTEEVTERATVMAILAIHEGMRDLEPFTVVASRAIDRLCAPLGILAIHVLLRDDHHEPVPETHVAAHSAPELAAATDPLASTAANLALLRLEKRCLDPRAPMSAIGMSFALSSTTVMRYAAGEAPSVIASAAAQARVGAVVVVPLQTTGAPTGVLVAHVAADATPSARSIKALERVASALGALYDSAASRDRLALHEAALQSAANGIAILRDDGTIEHANRALADMIGISTEALVGRVFDAGFLDAVDPAAPHGQRHAAGRQERTLARATADPLPVQVTLAPIETRGGLLSRPGDTPGRTIAIVEDLSEQRAYEAQVANLWRFDALTGLPNRRFFVDQARAALARVERSGQSLAVLMVDIDDFKHINAGLGWNGGDAVLRTVAERIAATIRPGDLIARIGGDEFVILLSPVRDVDEVGAVAKRLLTFAQDPRDAFALPHPVDLSVGVAMYPQDGTSASELLAHADLALDRAKTSGRRQLRFFSSRMDSAAQRRGAIERALHGALERGELRTVLQPLVRLRDGALLGAEASVRWESPILGTVAPEEFLPVAEEIGLIDGIGRFVLAESAGQLRSWDAAGFPPLRLAVDLSVAQFRSQSIAEELRRTVAGAGVTPARIELELAESALTQDIDATARNLRALREAGFSLAIDDFGTAASSLVALRTHPVGRIKIDRSFVDAIAGDPVVVRATVQLAHALGLTVVAEGVATSAQETFLRDVGCDEAQGPHVAPPLELMDFVHWARHRLAPDDPRQEARRA